MFSPPYDEWQERSCILWFIQILDDEFFTQLQGVRANVEKKCMK